MMIKQEFKESVMDFLDDGTVEGIKILNTDVLKTLIFESDIFDNIYNGFKHNFECGDFDLDDIYMKTGDMIYRLHLLVNDSLVNNFKFTDSKSILDIATCLIEADELDLYSAVNYNEDDLDIIRDQNEIIFRDLVVSKMGI